MKKVIIVIILICFSLLGISQTYPTPYQSLGSINIAVRDTGGLMVRQTLVMPVYTDTAAANTMGYPKNYAGSQIFTSGNNKFWIRNFSKTAWINVGSGSGGSATWQDVLSNNPDLTTDNYPNLNYKAFQMSHVGTYSITNSTVSSSHESHIVMDSSDAEISNRDATLHLNNTTASLTGGNTELKIYNDSVTLSNQSVTAIDTVNTKPLVISTSGKLIKTYWFGGGGSTSSWSLTGNPLTTSANFIGTLDAQPFRIVVNNDTVGKWDLSNSIAFGSGANYMNTGTSVYSFGGNAGNSNTGNYVLALGIGAAANNSGEDVICIGADAGGGNKSGESIFIGTGVASNPDSTFINANAIGARAYVNQSNSMVLGSINGINGATASTNVGIGTTTPTATLDIDGSIRFRTGGTAGYVLTSDASGNATWQTAGAGSGWGLNGNTGITSANYLGTTDGANLILKSAGNIIDSSDGRSIVTIGANINLISGVGITLTSGNKEITLNGVDTSTDATDSLLTINTSNIVKKRAYPTMPTNYWNKNADSNIYVIDTLAYVGIGTSIPTSALDVRGTIRSQGVVPDADSVGSIGSSPNRWKELWLNGGDALYLGTVNITDSSFATGKVLTGSNTGRAVWKTPQTVDTSLFALKSMPSYSLRVNNTNATANATTDNFRTVGETSLATSDTVTWSGSTAPSGGTSNTYRWTQIGNRVWVDITLSNTSNGSGVTGVVVKLPSTLPAIAEPTGQTAANQYMYPVNAVFVSSSNVVLSALARGGIRNNSVNNAYEMEIKTSSVAPCTGTFSFTYTTN